ncbi:alpha/beta hydrolase family protein [Phenylobacterium sp. J367]|uniref:alpha/beta hydrolase n=1 Tax=Phenylobacterium sp. J367 TaxID=2898435 RepID=UPI002150E15E|nr:alpha/beta hydrolase-fold protein [Phenylobacterium sp. J367]MCR5879244.1 alpha/beta hydrolase [Phenylobacterium sp. J367]
MIRRRDLAKAATLAAAAPVAAAASDPSQGRLSTLRLRSTHVAAAVAVSVYRPPGARAPGERYPLLLLLHGGGGSEADLTRFARVIDGAIAERRIAPLIVAMPAAGRSLYMDTRDGAERWESFILQDLLPHLRATLPVDGARRGTFVGGWSMGGLGALRLAFKHPETFAAVAALEPAVEPALAWREIGPKVKFWRSDEIYQRIFGSPVDEAYWAANNPATIARGDPRRLADLGVYLEVGDQDMLYLTHGVEFLHRVLFDARVAHEYRLVRGAEHVGPSLAPRLADALGFLGRQIDPPAWIDRQVMETRAVMDTQKRAAGLPAEPVDPRRIRNW